MVARVNEPGMTWGHLKSLLDRVLPDDAVLATVDLRPCDMPNRLFVCRDPDDGTYDVCDGQPLGPNPQERDYDIFHALDPYASPPGKTN